MGHIFRTFRWIITVILGIAILPVVGQWFVQVATDKGWYNGAGTQWDAAMSILSHFVQPSFLYPLAGLAGFVGGLWADTIFRRMTRKNESNGPKEEKTAPHSRIREKVDEKLIDRRLQLADEISRRKLSYILLSYTKIGEYFREEERIRSLASPFFHDIQFSSYLNNMLDMQNKGWAVFHADVINVSFEVKHTIVAHYFGIAQIYADAAHSHILGGVEEIDYKAHIDKLAKSGDLKKYEANIQISFVDGPKDEFKVTVNI